MYSDFWHELIMAHDIICFYIIAFNIIWFLTIKHTSKVCLPLKATLFFISIRIKQGPCVGGEEGVEIQTEGNLVPGLSASQGLGYWPGESSAHSYSILLSLLSLFKTAKSLLQNTFLHLSSKPKRLILVIGTGR